MILLFDNKHLYRLESHIEHNFFINLHKKNQNAYSE
jgi:hypothetical protein